VITGFDWKAAHSKGSPLLTPEEKRVLDLLAEGKSTPAIAKTLGTNRSAIWTQAKRIRKKFTDAEE
jgi:DNA-binding CsgD family transcriptional regulator